MQLQLEAAEAERADDDLAVALLGLVGRLDAADAERRRLGVAIGPKFDRRIVLPIRLGPSSRVTPMAPAEKTTCAHLDGGGAGGVILGLDRRRA